MHTVVASYVSYKSRGCVVMSNFLLSLFAWHIFGGAIARVSDNAFGLPFSMNTLMVLLFLGAMIVAFAAWMFAKNAEGFFE